MILWQATCGASGRQLRVLAKRYLQGLVLYSFKKVLIREEEMYENKKLVIYLNNSSAFILWVQHKLE